jgi:hypothetical protein
MSNWPAGAATIAYALPLLTVLGAPTRARGARVGILIWSVILFVTTLLQYWLGRHHQHNAWVGEMTLPVLATALLWSFYRWQIGAVARQTVRVLIPLYLVATLILTLTVESLDSPFSLATNTITSVLILALSLYTLLTRTLAERGRLTRLDWFWICCGLALFYGSDVALEPFARAVMATRVDLVIAAMQFTSLIEVVAMLAITRGMLCPNQPLDSGGSSSLQSLVSRFSSRHSERHS